MSAGVVQRRKNPRPANENGAVSSPAEDENDANQRDSDVEDADSKVTRLTLMEEVLLLGLKDKEVCTVFVSCSVQNV